MIARRERYVEIVKVLIAAGGKDILNEKDKVSERYLSLLNKLITIK
jgi:predicted ABC-type ATPase